MAKAAEGRTQKDMVEELLDSGVLSPSDIVQAMKDKFGVEASKSNVNQIKVKWKKAQNGAVPRVSKRKNAERSLPFMTDEAEPSLTRQAPAVVPAPIASANGELVLENQLLKIALKLGGVDKAVAVLKKLLD